MLIDDSFIYELDSTCRGKIARIIEDPDVLNCLVKDEDPSVRCRVAWNPNTSSEILDRLSYDKDEWVRRAAALNPNASPETLYRLSYDEEHTVRRDVAQNPNTSPEILDRLAKDKKWSVHNSAINNPNYKNEPTNIQVTNEQMVALKTLIESASDPHLQEMFQHIVK